MPALSHYDYYALDFIKALKKHTNVKRQLQKTWTSSAAGGGGGDSIFDDFFGSSSTKKQEKKEEVQEEKKLTVEEQKILEIVTFEAS